MKTILIFFFFFFQVTHDIPDQSWADVEQQWAEDTPAPAPAPVAGATGVFSASEDWATQVQEEFSATAAAPAATTNWAGTTSDWN